MSVVANVAINIDASNAARQLKDFERAVQNVASVADGLPRRLSAGLQGVGQKLQDFGGKFGNITGALASFGAGASLKGFIDAGVEAQRTGRKVDALAKGYDEVAGVNAIAGNAAKDFGLGQTRAANAVADLYGRLRPTGVSLKDIGTTFIGVNKAASLMSLSTADTEGVMLQLSQAMGSGRLQGDELRSVMERMPAIGQAIARVMGTTVGEIKQLGADGKITTDIIIKSMQELGEIQAPPPDAVKLYQQATEDLATAIGTKLMPVFTPLLQTLTSAINGFSQLPQPVQNVAIAIGAVVSGLVLIAAPLGLAISGVGALMTGVGALVGALSGMSILATIAGWLGALIPAIGSVISALAPLGSMLIAVFSGPVGWVALTVAAGVAVYAFRDKIASAFTAIGQILLGAGESFKRHFVQPVIDGAKFAYDGVVAAFTNLANALKAPFVAVGNMIRGVLNQILAGIGNAINAAVAAVNSLIGKANRALTALKLPSIPSISNVSVPRFAEGGVVNRPTLAMIGEGGEREFIVPESKASQFASSWMNDRIQSARDATKSSTPPTINLQTGPVLQQDDGEKYVRLKDLETVLQDFATVVFNNSRSAGGRRYQGVN
jgi:tape measure domain-containing protein